MRTRYQRNMTRLGFLGAMNRDLVVQQSCAAVRNSLQIEVAPLMETPVSDADARRGADFLKGLGAADHLGGSAFNAARVAAMLDKDRELDLAFFGIAGTVEQSQPHLAALGGWGFDTTGVEISPDPPATCLAMVEQAGRTLLTAPGANAAVADWMEREQSVLAASIAQCTVIHITSYLDPATPELIARIIEQARTFNPALIVSLDPGMAWVAPGGEGLARLLALANILHLNNEEFIRLFGTSASTAICSALQPGILLLARTHEGVTIYTNTGVTRHSPRLLDVDVKDATGAGDTFCGAFLWSYCRDMTRPQRAAALGFALARHKVGRTGPLSLTDAERQGIFAQIDKEEW